VIEIPAEYGTLKKRVQKTPPTTRAIDIPAEYKTVKVRKMVSPPQEKAIEIPAEYTTVTRRKLTREGAMAWREILCETNIRAGTVTAIQRALEKNGFEPGPIDGVIGHQTLAAVRGFQSAKGLPEGGLTIATLDALGVEAGR
jgi:peptidoglycan hydrolase-like protein with peptidoglycan-binding domain